MSKPNITNMTWAQYERFLKEHYTKLTNPPYTLETYLAFGREVWEEQNERSYRVRWTNFNYYADETFTTRDAAVEYGVGKCQEFTVEYGSMPVCSWSPISGLHMWTESVR